MYKSIDSGYRVPKQVGDFNDLLINEGDVFLFLFDFACANVNDLMPCLKSNR